MVKRPQGVGKSYSLVNLTRCLLASGNYLVTIIPDCDHWNTMNDLFIFILNSVGVDADTLGLTYPSENDVEMKLLINDIDQVLQEHGKKSVFVFDQINRIFARPQYNTSRNVGMLPFPFKMIAQVRNLSINE